MSVLGRADFEKRALDLPIREVEIEGWGTARLRGLSAAQRDQYEASTVVLRRERSGRTTEGRDYDNVRAKLVVRCLVDADDQRLFGDHEYDVLGQLPATVVNQLWEVASELSGMTDEDVKELVEGFEPTRGESSTTPSPSPSGAQSPSSSTGSPPGS